MFRRTDKSEDEIKIETTDNTPNANEVTIHIWSKAVGSVGHTSLQTQNSYISCWPVKENTLEESGKKQILLKGAGDLDPSTSKKGTKIMFRNNYEEDVEEYGRPPDHSFTLKSLNVMAIEDAFNAIKNLNSQQQFSLWGSSYFKRPETTNCAALVGHLLLKGGIKNLVDVPNMNEDGSKKTISTISEGTVLPIATAIAIYSQFETTANFFYPPLTSLITIPLILAITGLLVSTGTFVEQNVVTPNDIKELAEAAFDAEQSPKNVLTGVMIV